MTEALFAGIREDPLTAAIGCAAIVPVAAWIVAVVGWMVMGEMDFLVGTVAVLCAAMLGMVALWPAEPVYAPVALAGILLLMVVFPIVRRQLDRRALATIDVEQIEGAYQMLAERPENASAMFKLAERLYHRGLVAHAVGIGERALSTMPKDLFQQEHRALQLWRKTAPAPAPLPCLRCGQKNAADVVFCERCGGPYLAEYARGRWLGPMIAMRLVAAWAAAMVALVGLPSTLASIKDPVALVALVVLQVAVVAVLVWRAFLARGAAA